MKSFWGFVIFSSLISAFYLGRIVGFGEGLDDGEALMQTLLNEQCAGDNPMPTLDEQDDTST
jgi:hypothetical protein